MLVTRKSILFTLPVLSVLSGQAFGQATLDNLLSTVQVSGSKTCAQVEINLNRLASVVGVSPSGAGANVDLRLTPLATTIPDPNDTEPQREAASVSPGNAAGLQGVSYDPSNISGPVIHVSFGKKVSFRLQRDTDNRHIVLKVSPFGQAGCAASSQKSGDETPATPDDQQKSDLSLSEQAAASGSAEAALVEGKKQLNAGEFPHATAYFTKAVATGTGRVKQDAQEMLGLSRERAGQLAFARAEYQTYLKLYPSGEDAARVKDRLAGVVAAMDDAANSKFDLNKSTKEDKSLPLHGTNDQLVSQGGKADLSTPNLTVIGPQPGSPALQTTANGMRSTFKDQQSDPNAWHWEKSGSVAQYYYRDDNFAPAVPGGPMDQHTAYQNEILSSVDLFARGENQRYAVESRLSLYDEQGFGQQANVSNLNVSTAYVDARFKDYAIETRLGRQSKSTGGVFGRFDGGLVSWDISKSWKLQAVAGSPAFSRSSSPFADGRYFYGTSLDYTFPDKSLSATIYAIEQNVENIVDRRAIGADVRYNNKHGSIYGAADYDIFYGELNNGYVSGTWLPRDGTTVYATVDYRKSPFLLTSNAMMGQNFTTLGALVDAFGLDNAEQLAVDRTASSESATFGVSQELNKKWQVAVDGTVAYYSGTPASGGVAEVPDPGLEYYGSIQFNGTGIIDPLDSMSFGLRYSHSESAAMYMADASVRYPINENLKLGPRFRASLRDSLTSDQVQWLAMPSLGIRYHVAKNWNVEAEAGARWQDTISAGVASQSLDLLATLGYRFDF